ncbi:MAG TPA: hypothetical protein VM033_07890 [Gemmatimonadaceae bacterium]|nr:hypothetical protein [Gemmatimonadaceae bacterium]
MAIDNVLVPIVMFSMIPIVAIGVPIARAYARRLESKPTTVIPTEVAMRLERMEQAIDSIAVEVERISEGQRFTTKLLAERVAAPVPPPVTPDSR